MAVRGRHHHAKGGRVEQHDHPQLEQADVVASDAGETARGRYGLDEAHAGRFSTANRDIDRSWSARGKVSSAIDSMPDQTNVAIATCRPLNRAAAVSAAPAPTATCSASTTSVARAAGPRAAPRHSGGSTAPGRDAHPNAA